MGKATTYFDFGYKDGEKKFIRDSREGQEAYDFFMVSRYLKDIIAYRKGDISLIHHKEDLRDNLKKYSALEAAQDNSHQVVFYEVGSSLMGAIDSLEFINKKIGKLDVRSILFSGVDNSDMMNDVASYLYKDYNLALFKEKAVIPCDLFFAKGVSILYAFEDEESFCDILKKSRLAIFDYTFSMKDKPIERTIGSGKKGVHLSLLKCKDLLKSPGKELLLKPSKRTHKIPDGSKLYECIYGEKELLKKYLSLFNKNHLSFFKSK